MATLGGKRTFTTTRLLSTIYQLGCALTSLSMALNFGGVPTDPGSLNQFMIQHDTDYSNASVNWGPTTKDISILSGKKISFQGKRLNSRSSLDYSLIFLAKKERML